jgi:hypothetical protein
MDMPPRPASFEVRGGWVVGALIKEFGLTPEQAAGIVGNLGFESSGFETLQEVGQTPPSGGWGWAQWTGPRRRAFEAWCAAQKLDQRSDEANYGYLVNELRTSHAHDLEQLKKTTALDSAVFTFGVMFEAPGGTTDTFLPGNDRRLQWANRALTGYKAAPQPGVPMPDPTPVVTPTPVPATSMVTVTMTKPVADLVAQLLRDHTADIERTIADLSGKAA